MKTCLHLAALEQELEAKGIPLGPGDVSPYGPELGTWFSCDCIFDEPSLRKRLALPECVDYQEYDGRMAGSDATFLCRSCKRAIMGVHPRYPGRHTARLK